MVQGFVRLGTAAKQTVVLGRHPLASGVNVISTVGVALAYFFAARLSLALLEPVDGVAIFWPAAGVASGILIALGSAARWPVVVGLVAATIAANLLGDRNIWGSLFFAAANAGEAVIVAGLIHRFCGSPFELNELRRVLALFAATVAGTSLSGILGTVGFVLFHGSTASPLVIWLHWFSSDALGTIVVAPLAIGLASLTRNLPPRREIAEGVLALAVVSLVCALLVFLSALDRISPSFSVHRGCHVHHCDHDCLDDNLRNRDFRGFAAVDRRACAGGPSYHPGDLTRRPGSCGPV